MPTDAITVVLALLAAQAPVASSAGARIDGAPPAALRAGQTLQLDPGGFVDVEDRDGARLFCANAGASPFSALYAGTASPLQSDPPLACRPLANGAQQCDGEAAFCWVGRAQKERANATSIYVMDFTATTASTDAARVLSRLVAVELSRAPSVHVVASDDVRGMLGSNEDQGARCVQDVACLSEVVAALGARYIIAGSLAGTGRALRFELSLIDTRDARTLAREHVVARDLIAISAYVDELAGNLLGGVTGVARLPLPDPNLGREMDEPRALWSAVGVGAATAGTAAACVAVPALGTLALSGLLDPTLRSVNGLTFMPSVAVAPCCGLAGAGAGAVAGDLLTGARIGWLRAAGAACAAGGCIGVLTVGGLLAAYPGVGVPALLLGANDVQASQIVAVGVVAASGGAILTGALAGAVAYDVGIGVLGDEPAPTGDERIAEGAVPERVAPAQAF